MLAGRGSGSFLGGLLIGTVGTRKAFRIMGLMACAGGTLYGLLHMLWLNKYDKKEETDLGKTRADVFSRRGVGVGRLTFTISASY